MRGEEVMLLKDIVKTAADMLALDRVSGLVKLGGTEEDENGERELALLVRCANLVLNEAAAEYIRPRKVKEAEVGAGGRVEYAALADRVSDVIRIRYAHGGGAVSFRAGVDCIKTDAVKGETVVVEYVYTLPVLGLEDDTGMALERVSERVLGYGTAAEFCIISGMYEDAALWDKRYKDALLSVLKGGKEISVKVRRWR